MQTTNQKGATNATTKSAAVAKTGRSGRAASAGSGKANKPARKSAAGISISTKPISYERTSEWDLYKSGAVPADAGAEEQRAHVDIPQGYTGPSIKTLTRLAVLGLLLLGFVIGVIVGKVWL